MEFFLFLCLIVFFAASINSCFGFGDSMINMSLLSLLFGLELLSPLVALLSLCSTSLIVLGEWRNIQWRPILRLLISAIACVPLGILWLEWGDPQLIRSIFGLAIVLTALYNLSKPKLGSLSHPNWAFGFGALSGIMGGAFNITGPPVVLYGSLQNWSPERFRANLQGFFWPLGLSIVGSHAYAGNFNSELIQYFFFALPALCLGILFGKWLNRQIQNPSLFNRYVYGLLIVLGLSLLR
jgi:uncharacterized membrane protein YfcA